MTLFIPDWSNNNWSSTAQAIAACAHVINVEGYAGIIHKVSEGDYYGDPYWPPVRDWCHDNGVPVIGYHYVTTNDPGAQAQRFLANGGGNSAMLDIEANSGNAENIAAVAQAFIAAGITVAIKYLPHWYWQDIGEPDISQIPGALTSSSYYEENNYAATEYADAGGDQGPGWTGYGGATPVIWQFTDAAEMAGFTADANAFKGSLDDLRALFGGAQPSSTTTTNSPTITEEQMADIVSLAEQVRAKQDGVAAGDMPDGTKKGQPLPYLRVSQDRPRVPLDEPVNQESTPSEGDHTVHVTKHVTGRLWLDEETPLALWDMMALYVLNLVEVKGLPYVKQLLASAPPPPAAAVAAREASDQAGAQISWDTD